MHKNTTWTRWSVLRLGQEPLDENSILQLVYRVKLDVVSSVESRFRRSAWSLLVSPKQNTETKVCECSAVGRSSSDSRFFTWWLASFSLLFCYLFCSPLLAPLRWLLILLLLGNFSWHWLTVEVDQSDILWPSISLCQVKALFGTWHNQHRCLKKIFRYEMYIVLCKIIIVKSEYTSSYLSYVISQFHIVFRAQIWSEEELHLISNSANT